MIKTCPNLAYSFFQLVKFGNNLIYKHYQALKKML